MPTKTWEGPLRQSDSDTPSRASQSAEPRNFAPLGHERGRNPDASAEPEPMRPEYEEINTHGSER